ncbi:hypothetical protein [Demequina sp.]|uniref:hypothetical protein n=1 Tax=Demequina sp. TaxID=2050685 RepID=UPI0025FF80A8|nr:hypothetical protein [Demequina sp.]
MPDTPDGPGAPDVPEAAGEGEPQRTWLPLAIALSVAALVVIGSFVATALTARMSGAQSDAVRACEAAYEASAQDGEVMPRIIAGDVYGSAEWRDLRSFMIDQGIATEEQLTVTDAQAAERDDAAAALAADGRDLVTVVWWLDTEVHWTCTVDTEGDAAIDATAMVGPLVLADEAAAGTEG